MGFDQAWMMGSVMGTHTGRAFEAFCPDLFPGVRWYSHDAVHRETTNRVRSHMDGCSEGDAVAGGRIGGSVVEAAQEL